LRDNVSVCITAGNEEKNIRRCLQSAEWADEIVVVDSFSTDRTAEICREFTELVFRHRWLGYVRQKTLVRDLATGPWVLLLDADEEISPDLREEILEVLESSSAGRTSGYSFPRLTRYQGRWITHGDWYPDTKLRLFRKEAGRCTGEDPHDRVETEGPVVRLQSPLYHYTYDDIKHQVDTLNRFSSIAADSLRDRGASFRLTDLCLRPIWRFVRCYIVKRGFLDGLRGLVIAVNSAFGSFVKYAKLWEAHRNDPGVSP